MLERVIPIYLLLSVVLVGYMLDLESGWSMQRVHRVRYRIQRMHLMLHAFAHELKPLHTWRELRVHRRELRVHRCELRGNRREL